MASKNDLHQLERENEELESKSRFRSKIYLTLKNLPTDRRGNNLGPKIGVEIVMEPPKSLGPPTFVLVQRTSNNPIDAPESLDKFGICFSYLSQECFTRHADVTNIEDTKMRKQ
jgi:hypothetical protein